VKDSASGPVRFAKNLITNPVDTVSGLPNGAYKFMEEAGGKFDVWLTGTESPLAKQRLGERGMAVVQLMGDPPTLDASPP
jgi:hypothetical protein